MRIEIHPKPDGMQHINLMFCKDSPDPEDLWIADRLRAFPVPPKRTLEWEREGRSYTVLQFGQCVIGHAMFDIEKHKGIVDQLRRVCSQEIDRLTAHKMDKTGVLRLISETALAFHRQAKFGIRSNGEIGITLDADEARERLRQALREEARGERAIEPE